MPGFDRIPRRGGVWLFPSEISRRILCSGRDISTTKVRDVQELARTSRGSREALARAREADNESIRVKNTLRGGGIQSRD